MAHDKCSAAAAAIAAGGTPILLTHPNHNRQQKILMLSLQDVTVLFPAFQLGPLSLSIAPGQRTALLGRNGAGKSTLLKTISGQRSPTGGTISIDGVEQDWQGLIDLRDRVAHVRSDFFTFPWLSVKRQFKVLSTIHKSWNNERAMSLADHLELKLDAITGSLSRGNAMKFGLCCAWGQNADYLLLDEPTAGLDPVARVRLLDQLGILLESPQAPALMYVTHMLDELKVVGARVIYWLEDGQMKTIDHAELNSMLRQESNGIFREVASVSA